MTTLNPPYDPTAYLTSPQGHGSGKFIWQARMMCGPVIGGVDAFVDAITGFSPLEEWVMKPFAGDWDAFDRATQAWGQVGQAVSAVGHNIDALPGMVDDDLWAGSARDAWGAANAKVARLIEPLPQACDAMSQYCAALADLARALVEFVLESLKLVAETALRIIAEQAVPIAGQVAGAAEITFLGYKVVGISQKVISFITKFKALVEKISKVVHIIDGAIKNIAHVLQALAAADRASRAAVSTSYGLI